MTYCVGIRLNAGLDAISTFRKMMIYEKPGDRFMVMLSAGNLSISQAVREVLEVEKIDNGAVGEGREPITIWNATSIFDATRVLGAAVRRVYATDGPALKAAGVDESGHAKLLAFSCKRRGLSPSCGARRMSQTAAHLFDHVIPHVPVRQWVL